MGQTLYLIDGSYQAFRAFFGVKGNLRSPDGMPTNALYGYTGFLTQLRESYAPDYVLVCFDKGLSFRNEIYPDYKGQRPDMPADLRVQWPELPDLCEEMGLRAVSHEGYEADDIIGSFAAQFAGPELDVVIVSIDKDFAQLVGPHVRLLDERNDISYGPAEVEEKWGVPPERIIDLLALMGDSSDNVPGIPGVGQKKAANFVQRFGACEEVVAHAADIGGKTGEKVAAHGETVALAKTLVTIKIDIELAELGFPGGLEDVRMGERDLPALEARFTRYNFRRALAAVRADMGVGSAPSKVDRSAYLTINTAEGLADLASRLRRAGRFAYDSETTSLDPREAEFVGMSFAWREGEEIKAAYVPIAHVGLLGSDPGNCPGALEVLLPLLAHPGLDKTGQNLKYDLSVLRSHGHTLRGIDGDTMLADYLLRPGQRHGLDDLAQAWIGHDMLSFKEVTETSGGEFASVCLDKATAYAAEDAHVVMLIEDAMAEEGRLRGDLGRVYTDIELPLIEVLADMELTGIAVDVDALQVMSKDLGIRVEALRVAIHAEAGEEFNVNSTQQLARIFFEIRELKPVKKTKKGFSTDAATLDNLANVQGDPLAKLILEYRLLAKLKSTYVDALPRFVATDGRIHTSFHQAVASTGRLASNEPNLQNIPIRTEEGRKIRACFVPKPGHVFLSADYSQVELRILAHFCGEGPLVEAYREGEDIHRRTAAEIFGITPMFVSPDQRQAAKAINFGIVYGMSAFRLSNELKIPRKQAAEYIERYFERYPQVRKYMDESVARAQKHGGANTLFGRHRPVSGLDAKNPMDRGAAERVAINTPVQGTAADIIKMAMLKLAGRLRGQHPRAKLLLQVHDELVLEVPEEELEAVREVVVQEMQGVAELIVPLLVDTGVGRDWNEAH